MMGRDEMSKLQVLLDRDQRSNRTDQGDMEGPETLGYFPRAEAPLRGAGLVGRREAKRLEPPGRGEPLRPPPPPPRPVMMGSALMAGSGAKPLWKCSVPFPMIVQLS